jgi:hypothetical protein
MTGSEPKRTVGSLRYAIGTGFYSNMVYGEPDWDFKTLELGKGLTDAEFRTFYRLFAAPGMEHCGGGPGLNATGAVFWSPSTSRDPAHDVVSALARWVEDGAAPNRSPPRFTATMTRLREWQRRVYGALINEAVRSVVTLAIKATRAAIAGKRRPPDGACGGGVCDVQRSF